MAIVNVFFRFGNYILRHQRSVATVINNLGSRRQAFFSDLPTFKSFYIVFYTGVHSWSFVKNDLQGKRMELKLFDLLQKDFEDLWNCDNSFSVKDNMPVANRRCDEWNCPFYSFVAL